MQFGELTVTGDNSTNILLSGWPREVIVRFKHNHHHVPCNPNHHDHLSYHIKSEDEPQHVHQRVNHHHHDRQYFLIIEWKVSGIREIDWIVMY